MLRLLLAVRCRYRFQAKPTNDSSHSQDCKPVTHGLEITTKKQHAWSTPTLCPCPKTERDNMSSKQKNNSNQAPVQHAPKSLKQYAQELKQLQTDIESNDALSVNHSKAALNLVIKAGGILIEAKKLVKHGGWEKWVSANVPTISKRTAENYMTLAKKAADPQYVALLTDAANLRQAYIRVGIINKTRTTKQPDPEQSTPEGAESDTPDNDEVEITPEEMKETDKVQYDANLNEARQSIRTHVRKHIDASTRLNWNLATWTVKDNKPCSGDGANCGAALFRELQEWVAIREFTSLTLQDEVSAKAGIVLSEVIKTIILANTTPQADSTPEVNLADFVSQFSMEVNAQPVEAVEQLAV